MRSIILLVGLAFGLPAFATKSSAPAPLEHAETPTVIMYSAEWCPYCSRARDYLTRHEVAFDERDIEKSVDAAVEYEAMGAIGVPIFLIDGVRLNGFRPAQFWELYEGTDGDK